MKFFFDRNMSKYLARMIAIYERESIVVHLDDDGRFVPTTADVEWIGTLATEDKSWIVLTADSRILRNRVELAALEEAKLTFFCLAKTWSHINFHEYVWKFVKIWPLTLEHARSPTKRIDEVAGSKVDVVRPFK